MQILSPSLMEDPMKLLDLESGQPVVFPSTAHPTYVGVPISPVF